MYLLWHILKTTLFNCFLRQAKVHRIYYNPGPDWIYIYGVCCSVLSKLTLSILNFTPKFFSRMIVRNPISLIWWIAGCFFFKLRTNTFSICLPDVNFIWVFAYRYSAWCPFTMYIHLTTCITNKMIFSPCYILQYEFC